MIKKKEIGVFLLLSGLLCTLSCSAKTPILRFGVIADAQYADQPPSVEDNRYYRHSIRKMDECVDTFNNYNLDFVVHLGDFVDRRTDSAHCKEYFEELNSGLVFDRCENDTEYVPEVDLHGFSELLAKKYHIMGNHEYVAYQLGNNCTAAGTTPYSRKAFHEQETLYGLEYRYYSYVINKGKTAFRFIVLDGNESDCDSMKDYFPNEILHPQLDWFAGELDDAKIKRQNVIVFCHQGFFAPDTGHRFSDETVDALKNIMGRYSHIVAWMHGHYHSGGFNVDPVTGVPFYNFMGMLSGPFPENNAFSIVELYENELRVKKFRNEKTSKIPLSRPIQLLINAKTEE